MPEGGPENVTFLVGDALVKKFTTTCIILPIKKTNCDRFDYLFSELNEYENTSKAYDQKNFLHHKLVKTNKFTDAELDLLDNPFEAETLADFNKARKLTYVLLEYQELIMTVNTFLFQTHVARGLYSAQDYDCELFFAGSSKNFTFDRCKLLSGLKNNKKNHKIHGIA
jgi:hypothetical protein